MRLLLWFPLVVVACTDASSSPPPVPCGCDPNTFVQNFPTGPQPVDILFMIDDSSSMNTVQQNLIANFPLFINILTSLPERPNMHLAVTTSSMGAGAFTSSIPGCMSPDQGNFVTAPRSSSNPTICMANHLDPGEHFIRDYNGGL